MSSKGGSQKRTGESRSDVSNEQEETNRANNNKKGGKKQIIYKIGDEDD